MKYCLFLACLFAASCSVIEPESVLDGVTTSGIKAPIYTADIGVIDGFVPSDAQSNPVIGLGKLRADPSFAYATGTGYSVAVIDTGIDIDHPAFGVKQANGVSKRIVANVDFGNPGTDATDVNGHGSNVAGIVGSADKSNPGVAPGVNIIALKVFTDKGSGTSDRIEQALQWVALNAKKYNIASINMSLGDAGNYKEHVAMLGLDDEFAYLSKNGVLSIAAAGNGYGYYGSFGVSYPAADANVLAVGAVFDSNIGAVTYRSGAKAFSTAADVICPFAQRWNLPMIWAPGAAITSASKNGGNSTYHGTSQASPHVAGVAALAQQIAVKEIGRRLTLAEFTSLVTNTGKLIIDGDDENDSVPNTGEKFARIDVYEMAKAIRGMKPVPTPTPKP